MKQTYTSLLVSFGIALAAMLVLPARAQTVVYQQTFESLTTASPGGWILDNSNCSLVSRNRWAIGGGSGNNVAIAGSRSLGIGPSNAGTVATALGYTAARTSDDGTNCSGTLAGAPIYAEYDFNTTGKTHITVTFKWKCTGEYTAASGGQYLDYGRFWCYDGASWWWSTDGWISYAGTYNTANKGGESNTGYFWNFGSSTNNGAANTGYKWQTFYLPSTFDNTTGLAIGFEWRNDASSGGSGFIIDDITISSNGQIFLPVELVNFGAVKAAEGVLLNWTTASEKDNDFFDVEKSQDGSTFTFLQRVKGIGSHGGSYTIADTRPFEGINYYRLRQVDFDGQNHYSPIVSVDETPVMIEAGLVYPNPATGQVFCDVFVPLHDVAQIEITDYTGRVLLTETKPLDPGKTTLESSLGELGQGYYFYKITFEKNGFTKTFQVIRN
ncbi:MAG: T9SS type A sorting domain-containing protein [Bacteroidetes bacterium]|nr:T9SS type A sorting domain-containing protein [Bacteroidota bacterium]